MNKIKQVFGVLSLVFIVSGCVEYKPVVAKGYTGRVAIIKDTAKIYSPQKVDFFYVSKYNGSYMDNSRGRTLEMNYGAGLSMVPQVIDRKIPIKKCTITITARTEYAAPILALSNTVYKVEGEITFLPKANHKYVVRGVLGENYSAVWLKDTNTGKRVGKKIEINGSAELGFFEK